MSSNDASYDQQLVLVLSSAIRSSPTDAVVAILSAESFAREVNQLGPVGSSALHLATWRNHGGIVKAVLSANCVDVNVQDEESGWTALHRALYFGYVRVAAMLMAAGAKDTVRDHLGRRAVDLVSKVLVGRVQRAVTIGSSSSDAPVIPHGHVFSWGNGSNYTLGTGSLEVELAPSRVDTLHMHDVQQVGAAKFHSAAVTVDGKLFTWGWGRGGRLGHPESSIHSGNSAVIHPRLVASLVASGKVVKELAVAKHHTLLTTTSGELFSMGGNRYGQLGLGRETLAAKSVVEPRKVMALRASFVVKVAAANKHSVAVTSTGEVYTWGSNTSGQLGYGAIDSTASPTPRVVDAMKGRRVMACAAAKRHTVVLTVEGDVLTWGHRGVSPRKVNLNSVRNSTSLDGTPLRFQKGYKDVLKPRVERICAGAAHTSVLTTTGVVLTWRSADPQCQVQEIGGLLAGERVIDISAGKYRTAAVTDIGVVYMWEGRADYNPAEGRLAGSGSKNGRSMLDNCHGRGIQMVGSSIDSMSSHDGSYLGSSPGSFSHRFGSPSMMERMHSRFRSVGVAAHSPSPSGGSAHSFKGGHVALGGTPSQHQSQQQNQQTFEQISPAEVDGLRRIRHVAVGEKHSLALQSWMRSGDDYFSADIVDDENDVEACAYTMGPNSLQVQCQETIAKHMVDPHTVLQVMLYAEAAGADMLYRRCCCVAALNLDIVLTEHPQIFAEMPSNLLHDIEIELGRIMARGSSAGSSPKNHHNDEIVFVTPTCLENLKMRCPTRADRALGSDDSVDVPDPPSASSSHDVLMDRNDLMPDGMQHCSKPEISPDNDRHLHASEESQKLRRLIMKKMEQIEVLGEKSRDGVELDSQQVAKLGQKGVIMSALVALDGGVPHEEVHALLRAASQAVVDSQKRSGVGAELAESRETSANQARELHSRHGQEEMGKKKSTSMPTKQKSKRKSKTKVKDNTDTSSILASNADDLTSTGPSNKDQVSAVVRSLRQIEISEVRSRESKDGPAGSGPCANGPSCIVGFTPSNPEVVAGSRSSSRSSEFSKPHQTPSPIKTVGFRPSMDGKPRPSSSDGTQSGIGADGPCTSRKAMGHTQITQPPHADWKQPSGGKQHTRKGGLTMFLRGELDSSGSSDNVRPAWGGPAKVDTPVSPLSKWFGDNGRPPKPERTDRDMPSSSSSKQTLGRVQSSGGNKPKKVSLAAFMGGKVSDNGRVEAALPIAWSSEKASPLSSKPVKSLLTIQTEQEELRAATRRITFARSPSSYSKVLGSDAVPTTSFHSHSMGQSPHSMETGFLYGTSPHNGGKVFIASSGPSESRWYISEEQSMEAAKAKSLKDIQAEESAAKEIAEIEAAFRNMERYQRQSVQAGVPAGSRSKRRSSKPKSHD